MCRDIVILQSNLVSDTGPNALRPCTSECTLINFLGTLQYKTLTHKRLVNTTLRAHGPDAFSDTQGSFHCGQQKVNVL